MVRNREVRTLRYRELDLSPPSHVLQRHTHMRPGGLSCSSPLCLCLPADARHLLNPRAELLRRQFSARGRGGEQSSVCASSSSCWCLGARQHVATSWPVRLRLARRPREGPRPHSQRVFAGAARTLGSVAALARRFTCTHEMWSVVSTARAVSVGKGTNVRPESRL